MLAGGAAADGFSDDELVMISALEHWSYCPRQCALIHLEQTYDENIFTLRGNRVHERAHDAGEEEREGVRTVRGMPLLSRALGLTGKADIVEFRAASAGNGRGRSTSSRAGEGPTGKGEIAELPYPVEYKAGPKRSWEHEALQLCAQAICLEEMLQTPVPAGAIYHYGSRSRREIAFDAPLRERVVTATLAIRAMLAGTRLPAAVDDARCPNCSLVEACIPAVVASPARIRGFQAELFHPSDR